MKFQHRLVQIAKMTALLSAVWTLLCALLIVGGQAVYWLKNGAWDRYPVSSAIISLGGGQGATYITASADRIDNKFLSVEENWTSVQVMGDWLLDIPTIVPLLIASALLLVLYIRLAAVEKEYSLR